jgi:DsbC/DsbD-like thiol-disulfide interchange protein
MKSNSQFVAAWLIAGVLALLIVGSPALAQSRATGPHTTVTMLASRASVATGVLVGLQFQMEKGWHIYWENPGDSGEPPKVQWQVPAGFRVGAIEWPAPEKLTAPSIVDYGYENDVLLFAPLSVPTKLPNGKSVTLAANVNWLVCREMCIPGKARVSLTLPVNSAVKGFKGTASSADIAELIKARTEVPKPLPATWKVYATDEKDDFVLTVETGKQESEATFFPLEAEQINNDAGQAATLFSRGVRLKLQKSDGLLKPIVQLRGVLELGPGRAYEITAPVYTSRKSNS